MSEILASAGEAGLGEIGRVFHSFSLSSEQFEMIVTSRELDIRRKKQFCSGGKILADI